MPSAPSPLVDLPWAMRVANRPEELVLLSQPVFEKIRYCTILCQHDGSYLVRWPNRKKRALLDSFGPWNKCRFYIPIR